MFYDKARTDYVGNLDYAEAASVALAVGQQIKVKRIVLVGVEVGNGAEVITVAVRDADGAGGSTTIGTFTIPDAFAVDDVKHVNIAERQSSSTGSDGNPVKSGGSGLVTVIPGQEISLTSTGGTATTGQADVYIEYIPEGYNEKDTDYADELTFTPA